MYIYTCMYTQSTSIAGLSKPQMHLRRTSERARACEIATQRDIQPPTPRREPRRRPGSVARAPPPSKDPNEVKKIMKRGGRAWAGKGRRVGRGRIFQAGHPGQ